MTREETAKIVAIIKEYYPRDIEATNIKNRIEAWSLALKDYEYSIVQMAVIAFATQDVKGFAPGVGQIIDKIIRLRGSVNELTEMEAWNLVQKAVAKSNYYADQEFEKLPPLIQKIIGSPSQLKEWARIDIKEFNTVIQSNFMRSFTAKSMKEVEYSVLPSNIKCYIESTTKMLEAKENE